MLRLVLWFKIQSVVLDALCSFVEHLLGILCVCVHIQFQSVQSLSRVQLLATPWTAARQASLSITNSQSLLKLMSHWVGDAIQPSHSLLSPSPPAFNLLSISVFSNESALCIRWPKYWSFSFKISSSNEYSGLISFRIYWFDLFAVQGTLKSLLQQHSSKASLLWHSAFFLVTFHVCTWLLEKT